MNFKLWSGQANSFTLRSRLALRATFFALILLAPTLVSAQFRTSASTHLSPELSQKLRRSGDLTLHETTLSKTLLTISQEWDVNVVVGREVTGTVSGVFKNAPLHEILHSILYANGYGYRVVGQGLVVMKLEGMKDLNPLFETATISLVSAEASDLQAGAQLLASAQGKVEVIPSARSLLVVDLPENVERIRVFAANLDQAAARMNGVAGTGSNEPLQVGHYTPQFVKAASLKPAIEAVLTKVGENEVGKVAIIEDENQVVVVDHASKLQIIDQMVKRLDVPRPQVRITALIYDISLEDLERLGINWNHTARGRNSQTLFTLDSLMSIPATGGTDPNTLMTFMNLSRHIDITAVIDALSECNNSRLLADPSITVVDRAEASIQIVTEIPYQEFTQTGEGGAIGTTAFKNAGVTLKVTPHIANNGTISMQVTPTFSRLAGFTPGAEAQPIINTREANTTVRVANHQTFVIGGLKQKTIIDERNGVPYLKNIKKFNFGGLFRSSDVTKRESELVVFITPEIVTPMYAGHPREQSAYHVGHGALNSIHSAHNGFCGNPFCRHHKGEYIIENPIIEHLPPVEKKGEIEFLPPTNLEPEIAPGTPDKSASSSNTKLSSRRTYSHPPVKRLPGVSFSRDQEKVGRSRRAGAPDPLGPESEQSRFVPAENTASQRNWLESILRR